MEVHSWYNIIMNKLLVILLAIGIICSGMWCASYVMSSHNDCHANNAFSVMCVETLEHGSIISGAILTLVSVALLCVMLRRATYFWTKLLRFVFVFSAQSEQFISRYIRPTQLQLLFARGILHPRKP